MCRMLRALLGFALALALVQAVPVDVVDAAPSVLVAVELPELLAQGSNSRDLTFRLDVHESERPCGFANVSVGGQDIPYAGQGALLSRDGREFVGTWDFVCVSWDDKPKEQLMRFNVSSIDGKDVRDLIFSLQFSQTRPVHVSGVRGARLSQLPAIGYAVDDVAADAELILENEVTELEMLKLELADLNDRIVAKEHALAEAFGWENAGAEEGCETLKCTLYSLLNKAKSVFHHVATGLQTKYDEYKEAHAILAQSQDIREHPIKLGSADNADSSLTGRPKSSSSNGRPSIPVSSPPSPPEIVSYLHLGTSILIAAVSILLALLTCVHIRRRRAARRARPQSTSQRIRQHLRQRFAEKRALREKGPWARVCYRLREVYARLSARHAAHKLARAERWATRREQQRVRRAAFRKAFWGIFGYKTIALDEKSVEAARENGDVYVDVEALAARAKEEEARPVIQPNSVADEISALRAAADMVADMIADEVRARRARPLVPPPSPPQGPVREGAAPGSPRRGSRRRSLSPGAVSNWSCETLPAYEEEELLSNSEESLVSDGMRTPGGRGYRPVGQGADDVLGDIDLKDAKKGGN